MLLSHVRAQITPWVAEARLSCDGVARKREKD